MTCVGGTTAQFLSTTIGRVHGGALVWACGLPACVYILLHCVLSVCSLRLQGLHHEFIWVDSFLAGKECTVALTTSVTDTIALSLTAMGHPPPSPCPTLPPLPHPTPAQSLQSPPPLRTTPSRTPFFVSPYLLMAGTWFLASQHPYSGFQDRFVEGLLCRGYCRGLGVTEVPGRGASCTLQLLKCTQAGSGLKFLLT